MSWVNSHKGIQIIISEAGSGYFFLQSGYPFENAATRGDLTPEYFFLFDLEISVKNQEVPFTGSFAKKEDILIIYYDSFLLISQWPIIFISL